MLGINELNASDFLKEVLITLEEENKILQQEFRKHPSKNQRRPTH